MHIIHIFSQNVSPMIARESIRVEGQRGSLILEVEYLEMPQFASDEGEKFGSDLERLTSDLECQCATLADQMEVLQRRLDVLDGVARQIGKNALVTETERRYSPMSCQPVGGQQQQQGQPPQNGFMNANDGISPNGQQQQPQQQQQNSANGEAEMDEKIRQNYGRNKINSINFNAYFSPFQCQMANFRRPASSC
jgi:hypothetical protein